MYLPQSQKVVGLIPLPQQILIAGELLTTRLVVRIPLATYILFGSAIGTVG